jgi:hypothetical protein
MPHNCPSIACLQPTAPPSAMHCTPIPSRPTSLHTFPCHAPSIPSITAITSSPQSSPRRSAQPSGCRPRPLPTPHRKPWAHAHPFTLSPTLTQLAPDQQCAPLRQLRCSRFLPSRRVGTFRRSQPLLVTPPVCNTFLPISPAGVIYTALSCTGWVSAMYGAGDVAVASGRC